MFRLLWLYHSIFLSTPSARRATRLRLVLPLRFRDFYPRPPRGGRPPTAPSSITVPSISIHALREEGDRDPRSH